MIRRTILCLFLAKPFAAFALDFEKIHNYSSQAESGYVSDQYPYDPSGKSTHLYKIIKKNAQAVDFEEASEITSQSQPKQEQYVPITSEPLNKFYNDGHEIKNVVGVNIAAEKPLKYYVSVNLGHPISSTMNIIKDGTSNTFSGQNEIYKGLAGIYLGRTLDIFPYIRLEYGGQYEVLSFTEETADQYNNIRNHSGTATVRTFIDIPIFPNLAGTIGLEGGIGLFQHFYNETTVRTLGLSYAMLFGGNFALSRTTSFYILGRMSSIPTRSLSYPDGTAKTASLNSTGILAGMQFFI